MSPRLPIIVAVQPADSAVRAQARLTEVVRDLTQLGIRIDWR